MNSVFKKHKAAALRKNSFSSTAISIVILIEVIAIAVVATYSWVETVSSIKIVNDVDTSVTGTNMSEIDSYVFTEADIGRITGTIDLGKYFKPAGGMHLAPASSSDGKNMFFPQVAATNYYRKGNTSDMNTSYMSVSFKLTANTNADFFFKSVPSFTACGNDIRVSVISRTLGSDTYESNIYALNSNGNGGYTDSVTQSVVDTANGTSHSVTVYSFYDHKKGSGSLKKIFDVQADETKIVTINLWLQSSTTTWNSNLSQSISISDFGIVSDLSPRHVTLIPTDEWDKSNVTETFYAWCWDNPKDSNDNGKLYLLDKDDYGNYCFDYNGTYRSMVFVRAPESYRNNYPDGISVHGNTTFWDGIWSQTNDTAVPETPTDPTYVIKAHGSNNAHSTGAWILPAVYRLRYVNGQDQTWGTLTGSFKGITTSYVGTGAVTGEVRNEALMLTIGTPSAAQGYPSNAVNSEYTLSVLNASSYQYSVTATPYSNQYAFVGWYTDPEGQTPATFTSGSVSGNTTTATTASYNVETILYARFKKVRNIILYQSIDNSIGTGAGNLYLKVGSDVTSSTNATSSYIRKVVDLNSQLLVGAKVHDSGYTFKGICTTAEYAAGNLIPSATTTVDGVTYYTISSVVQDANYYAHFEANSYNITAYAGTGGTVKAGDNGTQGSSDVASVKYKKNVKLYAYASPGYKFVGWYDNSSFSGSAVCDTETYNYNLGTTGNKTFYAKFEVLNIYLTGYLDKRDVVTAQTKYKFTQSTSNPGVFELDYVFLNDGNGGTSELQYPTIFDGTNAYHPESHEADSGTAATTINTSPGANNKWKVDASSGARVEFTWDCSTNTLSWTVYYRIYFDKTNVSSNFPNVYITLDAYWDTYNNNGSGSNGLTFAQMTQISGTNLYYYETQTKPTFTGVAFVKDNQGNYNNFHNTKASYRNDLNMTNPVFKPNASPTEWHNGTEYFDNGSWGKYS